ncbi:MAG: cation-transporting P-type ATPase [Candidatus Kerfeldbacteria bacterium]|nr:cation-transporting P-type ATPase [Candidatus Kerfeldbacteria bacterium]
MELPPWHSLTVEASLERLGSTLEGWSPDQAESARQIFGPNSLPPPPERLPWQLFLDQFRSALIYILVIAATISLLIGETRDAIVIFGVVLLNAAIGYRQERQASRAMSELLQLPTDEVNVIRDGQELRLPIGAVVVGDIVVVATGDSVPADGRWVETLSLRLNEASLTGESVPISKVSDPLPSSTALTDQHNMGWRGTTVVAGRGQLLVTATGPNTRFGSIIAEMQTVDRRTTPFQVKLNTFSRRLAVATLGLGLLLFLLGLARQFPISQMFLLTVSMIVSIIPEGLPVVITVAMAYGMRAMARRQVVVRTLASVETLGAVTVAATDKTGTLTYGEMMMVKAWVDRQVFHFTGEGYRPAGDIFLHDRKVAAAEHPGLSLLLRFGALNNDARFSLDQHGRRVPIGDPTELALVVAAEKGGWRKMELEDAHPRRGEFPFDYQRKYMVTWHEWEKDQRLVVVKGAPQSILSLCQRQWRRADIAPLGDVDRAAAMELYEQWAADALRGLAIGYAIQPKDGSIESIDSLGPALVFVGLVGLQDAVRPEARSAIIAMRQAGIRTIMVTGDFRRTGEAVAARLALLDGAGSTAVLDGAEVDRLDDQRLAARLATVRVGTRLTPEHKLRIARLLKRSGEIVAMTGDGINDVPALTEADVGIAVGRQSSDAAKEAADLVLVDGNFENVTAAIAEGRRIYRNIRRAMFYLLASNFGELLLIVITLLAGLPLPLLPTHIIWLNAVTDPFLGIALAREPKSPTVMTEQPHDPGEPIVTRGVWARIASAATAIAAGSFVVYLYGQLADRSPAQQFGLTLTTIALAEWLTGLAARSATRSVFRLVNQNWSMIAAFITVVSLQVMILYIPALANLFHIAPLSFGDWLVALAGALPVLAMEEVRKWWIRRRYQSGRQTQSLTAKA